MGGVKSSLEEYRNISSLDWFDRDYVSADYNNHIDLDCLSTIELDLG